MKFSTPFSLEPEKYDSREVTYLSTPISWGTLLQWYGPLSTPLSRETPLKSPLNVKEDRLSTPFSRETMYYVPIIISTPFSWET
jgi:hypothetical protein